MTLQSSTGSRLSSKEPQRRRIKAPELDTSALIRDNALTLIGRVVNPTEQRIELLLSALPRDWSLKGKVFGSDLGLNCFQFRFELEEDLKGVLANRPYQFCRWMIVIQRWEPVIPPSFPSQIPFWIRIHGLPLHYWHEKALYNIGFDLGSLEDYSITKTAVKFRLTLDVFKAIEKEIFFDFSSGEELVLQLEYENLDRHCSICKSLLHEALQCTEHRTLPEPPTSAHPQTTAERPRERTHAQPTREKQKNFSQRLDRHGRPFGERPPQANRGAPLRNKLTPRNELVPPARNSENPPRSKHYSSSPLQSFSHRQRRTPPHNDRSPPARRPMQQQQWREKQKITLRAQPANERGGSPLRLPSATSAHIPPLERNLAISDFPQPPLLPPIPSREEVPNELHEVTLQYTSCADPTESAARRQ